MMELSSMRNLSANQEGMTNPWYPPPRASYDFVTESTPRLVLCITICIRKMHICTYFQPNKDDILK